MKSKPLRVLGTLALVFALTAIAATSASAANFLYWTDYEDGTLLRQDFTGGGAEVVVPDAGQYPNGVAIDRRSGQLYWAARGPDEIRTSRPDGSDMVVLNTAGAPVVQPVGVAIDDRTNRIYWANAAEATIGWAALDGSGGGALDTGAAPIDHPQGIILDTISDRVYWANTDAISTTNPVGWVKLSDSGVSGGVGLPSVGVAPVGLALDANHDLLFWTNYMDGMLHVGNAAGTTDEVIDTSGIALSGPGGVTFNPLDGKLYISNYGGGNIVRIRPDGADGEVFADSFGYPWGQPAVSGAGKLTAPALSIAGSVGAITAGVLQLKNTGDYPLILRRASASPSVFSTAGGCPNQLGVGETCELTVKFTPTSAADVSGVVTVPTDAGTFSLAVTGTKSTPVKLSPQIKNVRAVKRCAASAAAGTLSVAFTSATALKTTVTLQRSSSQRRTPPRSCPKRASNSDYASHGIGKINKRSFNALTGTQSATLKQLFKTTSLAPGRYRMLFSYTNASGESVRKGTWFWVLQK